MNRLKVSLYDKLRKQMSKAIRHAKNAFLSPESLKDQEEFTLKELKKKFPQSRKPVPCKMAKNSCKKHLKTSKRTTPGTTSNQSPPSSCNKEGKRWIKNGAKQIKTTRTVANHHGAVKK